MTRLDLIIGIHELTKKKKTQEINKLTNRLIAQKFEGSEQSFYDEWSATDNQIKGEKWHHFVRTAVKFTEIKYMFSRTSQLLRRYRNSTEGYFKAKFQSGIAELPDRTAELEQLFAFSDEYFDIYKTIINKLNFERIKIKSSGIIRGKINWNDTIRKSTTAFPLSFESDALQRKFDTPENILLVWVTIWLNSKVQQIIESYFEDPLDFDEIKKLKNISNNCKKIIRHFPFYEVIQIINENYSLDVRNKKIQMLESRVEQRLMDGSITNPHYKNFLVWFNKIKNFNFPDITKKDKTTSFLREATKNIDAMYEIWIFFELLNYFAKFVEVKLELNSTDQYIQFNVNHQEVKLFYDRRFSENSKHAWAHDHQPDFTFMTNQGIIGVLDAKNYKDHEGGESPKNKILAYMANLSTGYGGIIWPKPNVFEHLFPREDYGDSIKHHNDLKLVSYSLNPDYIMNSVNDIEDTLEKIFTEIKNRLEPSTECPKCGIVAIGNSEIEKLFGFRKMSGVRRVQSWCRGCRSL